MINIDFEKNNKKFNLKAKICNNADILKFSNIDYFKDLCKKSCPNYNTNWSCPPNSPRFDDFIKDYKYSLVVQMIGDIKDDEFMEVYKTNRFILEDILSNIQMNFECLKTAAGKCSICDRCAFLDNEICKNPEYMRYSMESMGVNLAKMSEELFNHKIDWNSGDSSARVCTSIGSIVYNGEISEEDFSDLIKSELDRKSVV